MLRFVTVHKVREENGAGKIELWKDCWDMGSMVSQAPSSWLDDLSTADTSWVFDATGLV